MEALETPLFDAVIPYHEKDAYMLPYCLTGLRRNIAGLQKIYIISRDRPDIEDDIVWIPESAFPFTLEDVGRVVPVSRSGWYYQQLLKLYAPKVIPGLTEYYLIPDSDVVFLRPVAFFKDGVALFDHGGNYNQPYFDHMKRLLPKELSTTLEYVGTTDCMMYRRDIVSDLVARVEAQHGCAMWEAMLKCVDPATYEWSGMSEQELYFHFALTQYDGAYKLRLLTKYIGTHISQLRLADIDFLSFHAWVR